MLVALVWGASFIAGRVVSAEMNEPTAALWRCLIATTVLLAIAFDTERGLPPLTTERWAGIVLLGIAGAAVYNLCFMYGLQRVSASRVAVELGRGNPLAL